MSSGTQSDSKQLITTVGDKKLSTDNRVSSLRTLMSQHADKLTQAAAGQLTGERLIQVACNSIRKNPDLLDCTVPSLFSAISEAASYGWVIDGILGQASLVPFNNRSKGVKEATLIPGYKGLRDLVARSGRVQVTMESVHKGDKYEYKGRFEIPDHQHSTDPKRRTLPVEAAYVVGRFTQTGMITAYSMTREECIAHRDQYSQGWKRVSKEGPDTKKAKDSPWHEENPSFRVMCMKTVLLECIHRGEFPMSVEENKLVAAAQEAEKTVVTAEDLFGDDGNTVDGEATPALDHEPDQAPNEIPEIDAELKANIDTDFKKCTVVLQVDQAVEAWLDPEQQLNEDEAGYVKLVAEKRRQIIRDERAKA